MKKLSDAQKKEIAKREKRAMMWLVYFFGGITGFMFIAALVAPFFHGTVKTTMKEVPQEKILTTNPNDCKHGVMGETTINGENVVICFHNPNTDKEAYEQQWAALKANGSNYFPVY